MKGMREYLFREGDLRSTLEAQREKLKQEIQQFAGDYLLNASEQDVSSYLLDKYRVEPISLHPGEATTPGARDVDIDVSGDFMRGIFDRSRPFYVKGTEVIIQVPFTGDPLLFKLQPSTYTMNPPRARIADGHLEFSFKQTDQNPATVKAEYERELDSVQNYLKWINEDVQQYNNGLSRFIADALSQRKDKLLKDRNLESALGIPLKRADTPVTKPVVRRKPPIKPQAATAEFTPDPTVPDAEYDHILNVVENMVIVMERSPHAFATMDEESLRNHILVQLNGHYEGQATGETFNFSGKTDILIRADGKNVFVAECKFWAGAAGFLSTIDQLLGYTTYRDTKTAVIIFNKNKEHASVLVKIRKALPTHSRFKRSLPERGESHLRAVFRHPNDEQREIYVAVLVFHIPTKD